MTSTRPTTTDEQIRTVALELFAERGYDATSVRDIGAAAGIRSASLYHHFPSKEEILWALTQGAIEELSGSWARAKLEAPDRNPVTLLRAFVRSSVFFHAHNQTGATLVNSQLPRLSPDHYARAVELRGVYEQELVEILQACLDLGDHAVPHVRVSAFAILQMTAAVASWFRPDGDLTIGEVASVYEELAVKIIAPT